MKRAAIVGYGAIAALHVSQMKASGCADPVCVYGPDLEKARSFARVHDLPEATSDLRLALSRADAAVICSPSHLHFEQALVAIDINNSVLVELPACATGEQAIHLGEAAAARGVAIHCAHTSRYLAPYRKVGEYLSAQKLGRVRQISYMRLLPRRERSWTDNALLHHAEHPLDLIHSWFGALTPIACVLMPSGEPPQDAALLGTLADGAPVSVAIGYDAQIATTRITLFGSEHSVESDGFSYIQSDVDEWTAQFDAQQEYTRAIRHQDIAFFEGNGVLWAETVQLTKLANCFAKISSSCSPLQP